MITGTDLLGRRERDLDRALATIPLGMRRHRPAIEEFLRSWWLPTTTADELETWVIDWIADDH